MEKATFLRHAPYNPYTGRIYNTPENLDHKVELIANVFDAIIHSPTLRAAQTAEYIAKEFNLPQIHHEDLEGEYFYTASAVHIEELIHSYEYRHPLIITHLPIMQGFFEHYTKELGNGMYNRHFNNLQGFEVDKQKNKLILVPYSRVLIGE